MTSRERSDSAHILGWICFRNRSDGIVSFHLDSEINLRVTNNAIHVQSQLSLAPSFIGIRLPDQDSERDTAVGTDLRFSSLLLFTTEYHNHRQQLSKTYMPQHLLRKREQPVVMHKSRIENFLYTTNQ